MDRGGISLSVHRREADAVKEQWQMFCNVPVAVEPRAENGTLVRIAHALLVRLFRLLVPGIAFTKRFPCIVWKAPQEFAEGLLAGLFFGDGHLDHSGALIYATCSEGMASDTRLLLWMLGYSPTIVRNTYRVGKIAFQVRIQLREATRLIGVELRKLFTPSITRRLEAARYAQDLGYEVRVRVDPILTIPYWEDHYADFVAEVKAAGVNFIYWTLETYREKNTQLDGWRERWRLPSMEWQPGDDELVKEGTHRHLPEARRIEIYAKVRDLIQREFPKGRVSLCKETHSVRRSLRLCNADCNCLV